MKRIKRITQPDTLIILYLILYFLINLIFLVDFPYVHSDESWLSGLSRNILMSGDIKVTEPFFDAYNRYPHAIKLLFHLLQAGFIKIFGYHIFSFRLISLFFSIATLSAFYRLSKIILRSENLSLFTTILVSLDLQYLYASHLARQEIIILFAFILSAYLLIRGIDDHHYSQDIKIAVIIGLCIGFHPNSFILAITIGLLYLFYIHKKKLYSKNLFILISIISLFAILFIGISLYMDPDYFSHYFQHGKNFGVFNGFLNKIANFFTFYKNVFLGRSFEYYLPQIKFQLLLFAFIFLLSIVYFFRKPTKVWFSKLEPLVILVLGINLGLFLIGRFNVTSIVFIFPLMYLLTLAWLENLNKKRQYSGLLILIIVLNTILFIPHYDYRYPDYLNQISRSTDKDERVLANLNSEYFFENGKLLAYRNLQYLNISFDDYIRSNEIDTIIYYQELDYIAQNSPTYNVMYGDLSDIYPEMKAFLNSQCIAVDRFTNTTYGTNLANLIDEREWEIIIYRVK